MAKRVEYTKGLPNATMMNAWNRLAISMRTSPPVRSPGHVE
ncbi:MAG: hypothetical protein JWO87_1858 [Phycisphaerales bacterium]|nr:hypothetical protein [Phycisphaerales bacterium]